MPRFLGEARTLSCQVQNIFPVGLLDDEDDKTVAGVDGDADVVIPLQNNLSRGLVKWRVQIRVGLERRDGGLDQKRQVGQLDTLCFGALSFFGADLF